MAVDSVVGSEALSDLAVQRAGEYTGLPSLTRVRTSGSKINDAEFDLLVSVTAASMADAGSHGVRFGSSGRRHRLWGEAQYLSELG